MSRDPRDSYDDAGRRGGSNGRDASGRPTPSRSSRPSDPGSGRKTPPNGLIKPPLPGMASGPRSKPPSNPRSVADRSSSANHTLARMHAPRGGPPERASRDGGEPDRQSATPRRPRGSRSVGQMARDLSRS